MQHLLPQYSHVALQTQEGRRWPTVSFHKKCKTNTMQLNRRILLCSDQPGEINYCTRKLLRFINHFCKILWNGLAYLDRFCSNKSIHIYRNLCYVKHEFFVLENYWSITTPCFCFRKTFKDVDPPCDEKYRYVWTDQRTLQNFSINAYKLNYPFFSALGNARGLLHSFVTDIFCLELPCCRLLTSVFVCGNRLFKLTTQQY